MLFCLHGSAGELPRERLRQRRVPARQRVGKVRLHGRGICRPQGSDGCVRHQRRRRHHDGHRRRIRAWCPGRRDGGRDGGAGVTGGSSQEGLERPPPANFVFVTCVRDCKTCKTTTFPANYRTALVSQWRSLASESPGPKERFSIPEASLTVYSTRSLCGGHLRGRYVLYMHACVVGRHSSTWKCEVPKLQPGRRGGDTRTVEEDETQGR